MKSSPSRRGFLLAVLSGACLLPSISNSATTVVGSGPDLSFLVLESPNLGARTYEVHYTYNSGASQDGYFLLSAVLASDLSLVADIQGMGNYFLDSITYNSVMEKSAGPPLYSPFWSHWVAGGKAGFPTATPVAADTWSFGSGISAPYRLIAPGSWDALYYADGSTAPSVSPIPEASSALLALMGSFVIFVRRRNA